MKPMIERLKTLTASRGARRLALGALCLCMLWIALASGFERERLRLEDNYVFIDRAGRVLRFVPDNDGLRHVWTGLGDIPPLVRNAFIAAEDERFWHHPGVDPAAIIRAAKANYKEGRVVSGGSTITMQLSRMLYPRERTYAGKLVEAVRSLRLEAALSKDEILEAYLNRVPMGGDMVGIGIASKTYFGKAPSGLTPSEAAVLASLPKAPGALNPYGPNTARLLERRNWVLERMQALGYLSRSEYDTAVARHLDVLAASRPFLTPHLVDRLLASKSIKPGPVRTTINLDLQMEVERVLLSHKERLAWKGASQASAIVIRNQSMEVLAYAGSMEYSGEALGYNDSADAPRSAGSTLKPFVYAMALESGVSSSFLLPDTLRKYRTPQGDYAPLNFDRRQYGPVTMRTSLGNSFNIAAIRMLESVGQEEFFRLLCSLGLIENPALGSEHYGLGLVIGNPEVRLEKLSAAYAMLANRGILRQPVFVIDAQRQPPGERVFSEETAFIISDMLSDPAARALTFRRAKSMDYSSRVAVKTGTSTDYRDSWAVGYTPEYTIGVWVGNPDGNPTRGLSGATGAAPVFSDIAGILYRNSAPSMPEPPEHVAQARVCSVSGKRPGRHCTSVTSEYFIKGTEPRAECDYHRGGGLYHELPPEFAGWLHDKNRSGSEGAYRLSKWMTLSGESDNDDAQASPSGAVRARVPAPETAPSAMVVPDKIVSGHVTIGRKAGAVMSVAAARAEDAQLAITYPLPGDRFIASGRAIGAYVEEGVRLEAVPPSTARAIEWYIDGDLLARAGPPYSAFWTPVPGVHSITAIAPDGTADTVVISVE